ncbi:hypothetical protein CHOTACABRAS_13 [Bacillus phage Chotacabras]|nr:hypothetical protein CHOTACABRAS_13 [Bacillus phage Chotacabras]
MYARVCPSCLMKHGDIIEKKISKGCIWGVMTTMEPDECYLDYMHEEEEND